MKQTSFNDSMTGVNPARTHGFGCYKSRRVVWGVRVDEKLLNEAKPIIRAYFGSDCRAVETFLAGVVATQKGSRIVGVNPRYTAERPLIGSLVVERNIRTRRKMVVEESEERVVGHTCGFCPKVATAVYQDKSSGVQQFACVFHGNALAASPKWVFVEAV